MGMIEGGSGGRSVAVELNIVPFVDLMSILIIFLLLTAVWIQSSLLNIDSSVYGKKSSDFQQAPQQVSSHPFLLSIRSNGYSVTWGKENRFIPMDGDRYDSIALLELLKGFKDSKPDKKDVVLSVEDSLPYKEMINGIDSLLSAGFPQISVATAGGL